MYEYKLVQKICWWIVFILMTKKFVCVSIFDILPTLLLIWGPFCDPWGYNYQTQSVRNPFTDPKKN